MTQRIEPKFSLKLPRMPLHKVWDGEPDSNHADSEFDDFVDLDQSVDDFQNFFYQMDPECDVDHVYVRWLNMFPVLKANF